MLKLVNHAPESKYVDLIVAFTEDGKSDEYDDLPAPPVRYYFGNWRPTSLRKPLTPLPLPNPPHPSVRYMSNWRRCQVIINTMNKRRLI